VTDEKPKVVVLDSARRERQLTGTKKAPTKAIVRNDQILLVTGDEDRVLLMMEPEAAYSLSNSISRAAGQLTQRRRTTKASLDGEAVLMWCDVKGNPVTRFQYPAIAAERADGCIFAQPNPAKFGHSVSCSWERRPRAITTAPESEWFDALTGFPVNRVEGRRFWRLCAVWMSETAGMARGW